MTSFNGLLPIMSRNSLITWPCEIRGLLTGRVSARKRLSRHRLVVAYANDLKPNKLPELNKRDNSEAAVPDCPLEQVLGTSRKFDREHRWPRLASFQKGFCNKYL